MTGVRDANGHLTQHTYDSRGLLTATENALGRSRYFNYDGVGSLTSFEDENGNGYQWGYDANNRPTSKPENHMNSIYYDKVGNVTGIRDGNNQLTSFSYDAVNRATVMIDAANQRTSMFYDAVGNMTGVKDANEHWTKYQFDAADRKTVMIDARNFRTTLTLDAVGNVLSVTDGKGSVSEFTYDGSNLKITEDYASGGSRTFAYNAAGLLTMIIDAEDRQRRFFYDAIDRVTVEKWYDLEEETLVLKSVLTSTYDAVGNLLVAANENGIYTMSYDAVNRVTVVAEPFEQLLTFSYDYGGRRILVEDSLGGMLTSAYDALNQLTTRTLGMPDGHSGAVFLEVGLEYDGNGKLTKLQRGEDLEEWLPQTWYLRDAVGRLTGILEYGTSPSTVLASYVYSYDPGNRLTSVVENGGTPIEYAYDETDQLTGDGLNTFTLDATGNRTYEDGYTVSGNQLTNDGEWSYSYDENGNLKSKETGFVRWHYGYDHRNQLISIVVNPIEGDGEGAAIWDVEYKYDYFGNRIQKVANDVPVGPAQVYVRDAYDGWNPAKAGAVGTENFDVWAELTDDGGLVTRYLRGDEVDQLFAKTSWEEAIENLALMEMELENYNPQGMVLVGRWLWTDRLGSVRNVLDMEYNIVATMAYDGWGNIIVETNEAETPTYLWASYAYDRETGVYYVRARYYDPGLGRAG